MCGRSFPDRPAAVSSVEDRFSLLAPLVRQRPSLLLEEKVLEDRSLGRMWCAVHSYDDRDISAKTYRSNTTSVSLRETASTKGTLRSPQGEAFGGTIAHSNAK